MGLFGPSREELVSILAEAIKQTVVTLDPDKRYLLLVPQAKEEELKEFADLMYKELDIANSNLRVVFVSQPNIKLLEF